eukprot:GHVP01005501.1.p2 GENE.GHVP01005501.1~~GHVP01005501.1.p2  ORF type:complete len:320 (+),score=68.59 GHVP01005501.1:42-962(+)
MCGGVGSLKNKKSLTKIKSFVRENSVFCNGSFRSLRITRIQNLASLDEGKSIKRIFLSFPSNLSLGLIPGRSFVVRTTALSYQSKRKQDNPLYGYFYPTSVNVRNGEISLLVKSAKIYENNSLTDGCGDEKEKEKFWGEVSEGTVLECKGGSGAREYLGQCNWRIQGRVVTQTTNLCCISRGLGIAPMHQISEFLLAEGKVKSLLFFQVAERKDQFLLTEEMENLQFLHPGIFKYFAIEQEGIHEFSSYFANIIKKQLDLIEIKSDVVCMVGEDHSNNLKGNIRDTRIIEGALGFCNITLDRIFYW